MLPIRRGRTRNLLITRRTRIQLSHWGRPMRIKQPSERVIQNRWYMSFRKNVPSDMTQISPAHPLNLVWTFQTAHSEDSDQTAQSAGWSESSLCAHVRRHFLTFWLTFCTSYATHEVILHPWLFLNASSEDSDHTVGMRRMGWILAVLTFSDSVAYLLYVILDSRFFRMKNFDHWLTKMLPVKILIRLHEWSGQSESSLGAHVQWDDFWRCGPRLRAIIDCTLNNFTCRTATDFQSVWI